MTIEKIEAKRKELEKKQDTLKAMIDLAEKLHQAIDRLQKSEAELTKAINDLYEKKSKLQPLVEKIETSGIKEFEQIKANMLAICSGRAMKDRLLPLDPAKRVVEAYRKEFFGEMDAWLRSLKAAMPKVFKRGMAFNDHTNHRVYVMLADEEKVEDKDLPNGFRPGAILLKMRYVVLKTNEKKDQVLDKRDFVGRTLEHVKF